MAIPRRRSQKEITEKYRDNLADYKRLYTWRRAIIAVTLLAVFGGIFGLWNYSNRAPDKFFSPGPVSSYHLNIIPAMAGTAISEQPANGGGATNCDACHDKSLVTGNGLTKEKFVEILRESFGK